MAEQAYAYVTLIPVAKGFQAAIAKEMGGVGDVGATAGMAAGSGFKGKFLAGIKGFAAPIAAGLGAAAVTKFIGDSITAASDLGESINAVNVSYGDAADGILALSQGSASALGISSEAFNAIATQFSAFATNIAGEGGDVVGFIDDLSMRGADFASVFNLDVDEALRIFQSGLAGETEPLRKFGIDLSAAAIEAYAVANGIAAAGEPLTEQQKQMARYGSLMEQTNKVQGDFANTSDGLANSQRILSANVTNLQADLGSVLVPTLAAVTSAMVPVLEVIKNVFTFLTENAATVLTFVGVLGGLVVAFNAVRIATAAWTAVQTVLNFVLAANPLGLIVIAIAAVTAGIVYLATKTQFFQTVWAALSNFFKEAVRVMGILWASLVGHFTAGIDGIRNAFAAFATFFSNLWQSIYNGFSNGINAILTWFRELPGRILSAIGNVGSLLYNSGRSVMEGLFNGLKSMYDRVVGWIRGLGDRIKDTFQKVLRIFSPSRVFYDYGVNIGQGLILGMAAMEPQLTRGVEMMVKVPDAGLVSGQSSSSRTVNYYAAPNKSFDAEQELRLAMTRARVL